jgi:hypothetical protein
MEKKNCANLWNFKITEHVKLYLLDVLDDCYLLPMTVGNWREYLTWTLGPRELKKKKLYRVFLKDIVILLCITTSFHGITKSKITE